MESPIKSTPQLDINSSTQFMKKVERGLSEPMGPVPTPNIRESIEMVMRDAMQKAFFTFE